LFTRRRPFDSRNVAFELVKGYRHELERFNCFFLVLLTWNLSLLILNTYFRLRHVVIRMMFGWFVCTIKFKFYFVCTLIEHNSLSFNLFLDEQLVRFFRVFRFKRMDFSCSFLTGLYGIAIFELYSLVQYRRQLISAVTGGWFQDFV
jgi:cellulose synthase/poly-beta-1,6-N-acetylglucosamine synthase-like glycosyltransferase